MKTKQFAALTTLSLLFLAVYSHADGPAPTTDPSDLIRCERFKMDSVSDLKQKLVEYCNLDKPYSFTGSDPLGGNPYITYCCRKKGT